MNNVILVGNPNTGKTTLFNSLTSSNEHTGNWHGVTVDSKNKSYIFENNKYNIVDLPGIYSLTPLSFEEKVSIDYIFNNSQDLIVNIVDCNNLYRNLYLTTELINAKRNVILVVNITSSNYQLFDVKKLSEILKIPVIKINANNKKEMLNLKLLIKKFYMNENNVLNENINTLTDFSKDTEIEKIKQLIKNNSQNLNLPLQFIAEKCYINDNNIIDKLKLNNNQKKILENLINKGDVEKLIKNKYIIIDNILRNTKIQKNNKIYGKSKIDKIVLNKYLCLPIFLIIMLGVFYLTFFSVGKFLSNQLAYLIQDLFGSWFIDFVKNVTSNVIILDFFETAILGGLGSVLSFLPQVVILFICLSIIEDSGYLSRVAFSLDDIFSKVGLSGKSIYTLLMGFGCSTSACITSRVMEDKNSKIKTAMLAPFMSCSAKLPIYVVIGGVFFGSFNIFVIFGLYILGIIVAFCLSIFYEKTFLKSKEQSFILEFPPYRATNIKRILSVAKDNTLQFLTRVGSILISINIIIWILFNFSFTLKYVHIYGGQSILQTISMFICPIFKPLGFGTWGAVSALIAGLVAKEIIVSTIAMLNGNIVSSNLIDVSKSLILSSSLVCFNPASAISFMLFCLLYSPCLATITVLIKEIGKKWTIISIIMQFSIAYILSLVLYQSVNLILNKGLTVYVLLCLITVFLSITIKFLINRFIHKKCLGCSKCYKKRINKDGY